MKAAEVTGGIVDRLIEQVEAGAGEFRMPWHHTATVGIPTNAVTGNRYRGANVIGLWLAALDHDYPSGRWATYRQWHTVGAQVRRGETATGCVYWKPVRTTNDNDHTADETSDGDGRRLIPCGFAVFNAAQVDHDPHLEHNVSVGPVCDDEVAAWFARIPAEVEWGHDRACYVPARDRVLMPAWDQFHTADGAWSTLAHELAHWTGHPDRLGRTFGRFGDDAYAVEELVAELSSAFTCATIGLDVIARPDHAAYLAGWLRVLRANPNTLHTVTAAAQRATDHLTNHQPTNEAPATGSSHTTSDVNLPR